MILVQKVSKHLYNKTLFEELSFVLQNGDKIGLVGANGCGKSTLLKIILGEIEADSGEVQNIDETIGYLPQTPIFEEDESIENFLMLWENPKAKSYLKKVGLENIAEDTLIKDLSGGQKTRLSLAKILLEKPSVLLLDEPTNHLDLEGLEWLENFIQEFTGAVLIVSHDRKLLDNSVEKIFEIDSRNHTFTEYLGGYTEYALEKEKQLAIWENNYQNQQKEKKRIETWLTLKRQEATLFPSPSKGKMIRAMEKRLQREILDNEIVRPKTQKEIASLQLTGEAANNKLILRCENITKSFGEKQILWGIDLKIYGKDHILLAGKNGSGKTTLIKILTGEISKDSGEYKIGENIQYGYFAQEHENLHYEKTVLDEFLSTERLTSPTHKARSILGSFLFTGDDVFKKVSQLSLGERVRLIFAKLTQQKNELLILDEPTNHLDILSREIIENALIDYQGAILVISHDRYFLERIGIDQTYTIDHGMIREHYM